MITSITQCTFKCFAAICPCFSNAHNMNMEQELLRQQRETQLKQIKISPKNIVEMKKISEGNYQNQQKNQQRNYSVRSHSGQINRDSSKTLKKNHQKINNQSITHLQSKRPTSIKQLNRSLSRQSFHTVVSCSSPSLSKRTFRVLRKNSSLLNSKATSRQDSINDQQFKSIRNTIHNNEFEQIQSHDIQKFLSQMDEWIFAQYPKSQKFSDNHKQIDNMTVMQLQYNNLVNIMVNKIEDYYTFYSGGQDEDNLISMSTSKVYKRDNFYGSFSKQAKTMSNSSIFMTLISFHCSIDYSKFIKWINTQQILLYLHNFHNTKILSFQQWAVISFEQFSSQNDLQGKLKYKVVRQLEHVKFDSNDYQNLIQIDMTFENEQKCFNRIIRIQLKQKPFLVEIYTQSSQDILIDEYSYFQKHWKLFEERLIKDGIIIKST